jgi:phosphotransferase system HPr-like phosphotransfer protein
MGLMALAAAEKTPITFVVSGSQAPQAMAAIRHLFKTRFEDALHPPLVQSHSR